MTTYGDDIIKRLLYSKNLSRAPPARKSKVLGEEEVYQGVDPGHSFKKISKPKMSFPSVWRTLLAGGLPKVPRMWAPKTEEIYRVNQIRYRAQNSPA